jgi:hypothetical protein
VVYAPWLIALLILAPVPAFLGLCRTVPEPAEA